MTIFISGNFQGILFLAKVRDVFEFSIVQSIKYFGCWTCNKTSLIFDFFGTCQMNKMLYFRVFLSVTLLLSCDLLGMLIIGMAPGLIFFRGFEFGSLLGTKKWKEKHPFYIFINFVCSYSTQVEMKILHEN